MNMKERGGAEGDGTFGVSVCSGSERRSSLSSLSTSPPPPRSINEQSDPRLSRAVRATVIERSLPLKEAMGTRKKEEEEAGGTHLVPESLESAGGGRVFRVRLASRSPFQPIPKRTIKHLKRGEWKRVRT